MLKNSYTFEKKNEKNNQYLVTTKKEIRKQH